MGWGLAGMGGVGCCPIQEGPDGCGFYTVEVGFALGACDRSDGGNS